MHLFFIDILNFEYANKYAERLSGGDYETSRVANRYFYGLKKALCYYAYARLMKNGDYNVDRFGTSMKQGEYSSNAAYKEKVTAYNDAFAVGDVYLKECVIYLKENKDKYPLYNGMGKITSNRIRYKMVGEGTKILMHSKGKLKGYVRHLIRVRIRRRGLVGRWLEY